ARARALSAADGKDAPADRRADDAAFGLDRLDQHRARLASGRLPEPAFRQQLVLCGVDGARHHRPGQRAFRVRGRITCWGLLRSEKVRRYLTEEERTRREPATGINQWPTYAERFTTPAIEAEIRSTGSEVKRFLGRKGDVLIWHGRLVHRGSAPRNA